MKKQIFILITLVILFGALFLINAAPLHAADTINVTINNQRVNFTDQVPTIVYGRTLVPVRGVFEMLGFDVGWNADTQQVTLTRESDTVVITIGNAAFTANGVSNTLDVPAQIIGGRTMLPIRAVLESVGYNVGWDGATGTVMISDEPIVVSQVGISDYGRRVAEEFLMQFPTIFMDTVPITGFWIEEGYFRLGWEEILTREVPILYFNMDTGGYYNRYGNRFAYDVPWLAGGLHAVRFQLFDFDNSGIPDILISSSTGVFEWYGFFPHTLYRYIDGAFRRIYGGDAHASEFDGDRRTSLFPYTYFYLDSEGNLVGYAWQQMPGMGGTPGIFSRIGFNDYRANIDVLARERRGFHDDDFSHPFAVWKNYITGEDNITWNDPRVIGWSIDPNIAAYLPGTNIRLTPVPRLLLLEESITESVSQRLRDEGWIS